MSKIERRHNFQLTFQFRYCNFIALLFITLQNPGWFIATECFRAGTTFPDLTQLFQLRPILPHHQHQHIIEGPYFPFISPQTKSRHPRLVIGKTSLASPPVSFRLVTMHHGLIALKYGRNKTLKCRD